MQAASPICQDASRARRTRARAALSKGWSAADVGETLPPRPTPIPLPDRHQIERLNTLFEIDAPPSTGGGRGWLVSKVRRVLSRILFRQQEFNAAVVDHLNRNSHVDIE